MLFTDEVYDMNDLINKLSTLDLELDSVKVGVVCFIFDKNNNLILHRRGPGARDEVGKLLAIGGSVNRSDIDFRSAMKRELEEEAGSSATIRLDEFVAAQLDGKVDNTTGKFVNWIILAYKGTLTEGKLINNEPDRCIGFEKNTIENFLNDDLSKSCRNFVEYMINNK